jgi:hypothetical protein
LELIVSSNFEISAPQCSTHYIPDGRGDVLDIVVHQNVRLSEDVVTNILVSYHLPIMFSILDPVRRRDALVPVEKQIGSSFKVSPLNSCLQLSKFTILVKPIKQHVTLQPL